MALDLTNYYSYLNAVSANTSPSVSSFQNRRISGFGSEDGETNSFSFESALLSMINRSQKAYGIIADAAAEGTLHSESIGADASQLYQNLSSVLGTYNTNRQMQSLTDSLLSMKSSTQATSLQESVFSMLDNTEETSQASTAQLSDMVRQVQHSMDRSFLTNTSGQSDSYTSIFSQLFQSL